MNPKPDTHTYELGIFLAPLVHAHVCSRFQLAFAPVLLEPRGAPLTARAEADARAATAVEGLS